MQSQLDTVSRLCSLCTISAAGCHPPTHPPNHPPNLQEGAAANALADVRYKILNLGLLTAGVGHCLVLQVRGVSVSVSVTRLLLLQSLSHHNCAHRVHSV